MSEKRNTLPISKKIDIIHDFEVGQMRNGEIAKKYNMPPSSISSILSMREIIKADWNKTAAGSTRKHLSATGPIEKALSLWLTQQRTLNIPMSEPILA